MLLGVFVEWICFLKCSFRRLIMIKPCRNTPKSKNRHGLRCHKMSKKLLHGVFLQINLPCKFLERVLPKRTGTNAKRLAILVVSSPGPESASLLYLLIVTSIDTNRNLRPHKKLRIALFCTSLSAFIDILSCHRCCECCGPHVSGVRSLYRMCGRRLRGLPGGQTASPFTALLFVQALVVAPYVRALWCVNQSTYVNVVGTVPTGSSGTLASSWMTLWLSDEIRMLSLRRLYRTS